MKKTRYVVSRKALPTRLPVFPTVVLWLFLDRLGVEGWLAGAIWTLWGVLIFGILLLMREQQPVDPFEESEQHAGLDGGFAGLSDASDMFN